ncbi:DUF721 domain-containing protein [candidate division KSB1 bacterium]|nr:DUF721 domain-containing protein [candidate division KSB1 bacterium]
MKFQSLDDVLKNLVKNLGIEAQLLENEALVHWSTVVGPKVAKNTKAEKIKNGRLFVKAKNDVWKNELMFYKADIINKLNIKIGKPIVQDIIIL